MSSGSGVGYQSNDYYSSQPRGFLTPPPTWRTRRCAPVMPGSENKLKSSPQSEDCPFHIVHKVPSGDSPYVRAKHTQLIDKDPSKAISLFWAAINSGDRVDSALKDMAVVMKQLDRSDEAIEAIKSFRHLCPSESQESLDNILVELYKQSGRTEEEIEMLQVKLKLLEEGIAFGGKRTKMARSQGKKIHITIEKEYSRLLGNLAWAYMQQKDYNSAEEHYRKALSFESDKNKQCNLAICLMHMNKLTEAKFLLQATTDNGRVDESHAKSYERAYQTLLEFESQQPSPLPLSVKKRAFTGFPNEKRADYDNWKTNQCQLKLSQKETYSQLKRGNESPSCNRTIPKVPFTQPQRRARIGGPTDNAYGISCRKLSFGSFVGSENVNYYATAHPPSEAPKVMPNFSEKHFPFTGGDWRKNSSDNLVRNSGTVKLGLETAAEECVLPLDSASSTDCRKTKEETPNKNPGQGYRKTCEFSKYEHKSWADMVEEDEQQESLCSKGFNNENMDSNIIHETPKSFDQAEKLVQKIERIDLGSGYFTQPEKTALQKNQSTVRRSLCFDQNQNSDTAKFDCTSPLATKVFNFEDNDIGTPSSEEFSSNKSIKRRNRLQVFQDITLDSENP